MPIKTSFYPPILSRSNKTAFTWGFTLVELLIAISIFSVISTAIYSTFASGASILRRVRNRDFTEQRIMLKAERFARELRTQPSFKKQVFRGTKNSLSFAGLADQFPCRLTYYYDSTSLSLMRVEDKLDAIIASDGRIDPELKALPMVFLPKVKEANFSYLFFDLESGQYSWLEEWPGDGLPVAIRFNIITENLEYGSTVFLPTV